MSEYVRGLDLFDALRKLGILKDADTKFYTACILLALEHLYERNILHRDLKPENIILDEDGYPKLIDFGAATVV